MIFLHCSYYNYFLLHTILCYSGKKKCFFGKVLLSLKKLLLCCFMNYKNFDRFFGNLAHLLFENKSSLKLGPSKLFLISKNYLLLSSLMCAILFNAIGVANLILIYGFGEVFSTSFLNTSKHKYLIIRMIFSQQFTRFP